VNGTDTKSSSAPLVEISPALVRRVNHGAVQDVECVRLEVVVGRVDSARLMVVVPSKTVAFRPISNASEVSASIGLSWVGFWLKNTLTPGLVAARVLRVGHHLVRDVPLHADVCREVVVVRVAA